MKCFQPVVSSFLSFQMSDTRQNDTEAEDQKTVFSSKVQPRQLMQSEGG